jgi:nucleotide-binding universal stress UspA family protein
MFNKILAPLDGSELAACSLEQVKKVAATDGASEVILLRVVELISPYDAAAWDRSGYTVTEIMTKNMNAAREYLAQAAARLLKQGITSRFEVIEGRAAESILDYAEKNKVDLIVISTHGRSGISRFTFGSVADKVVRHSPIPVLVVSPPGCRPTRE